MPIGWPTINWRRGRAGTWTCFVNELHALGSADFDLGPIGFQPN